MVAYPVRQTICIALATGAALHALPATAGEAAKRHAAQNQGIEQEVRFFGVEIGTDQPRSTGSDRFLSGDCRDCDFENPSVRQYMPGETRLTFRPVGGTFSYHF